MHTFNKLIKMFGACLYIIDSIHKILQLSSSSREIGSLVPDLIIKQIPPFSTESCYFIVTIIMILVYFKKWESISCSKKSYDISLRTAILTCVRCYLIMIIPHSIIAVFALELVGFSDHNIISRFYNLDFIR